MESRQCGKNLGSDGVHLLGHGLRLGDELLALLGQRLADLLPDAGAPGLCLLVCCLQLCREGAHPTLQCISMDIDKLGGFELLISHDVLQTSRPASIHVNRLESLCSP